MAPFCVKTDRLGLTILIPLRSVIQNKTKFVSGEMLLFHISGRTALVKKIVLSREDFKPGTKLISVLMIM